MKILIADDHQVLRRGLKDLLRDEYEDVMFGEATNGREIYGYLEKESWDLILLDIVMPDANVVEILEHIRQGDRHVPVLILTAAAEAEYAVRTLKSGASGYITKQHASDELVVAVRKVLSGGIYLSGGAAEALAADLREEAPRAPHEMLSRREFEVFCLIARGKGVKEIAFDLSVSTKTVATYLSRIREKTGLNNYVDIARYALQHKLVD